MLGSTYSWPFPRGRAFFLKKKKPQTLPIQWVSHRDFRMHSGCPNPWRLRNDRGEGCALFGWWLPFLSSSYRGTHQGSQAAVLCPSSYRLRFVISRRERGDGSGWRFSSGCNSLPLANTTGEASQPAPRSSLGAPGGRKACRRVQTPLCLWCPPVSPCSPLPIIQVSSNWFTWPWVASLTSRCSSPVSPWGCLSPFTFQVVCLATSVLSWV